jgi:hydrogenase maturation factor
LEVTQKVNDNLLSSTPLVTSAVTKPVASATMFGEQIRPISAASAQLHDRLVLTKSVALEGTLILLSECKDKILRGGVLTEAEIEKGISELQNKVSVVKESLISVENSGVNAMHDPTEGGLLNALYEVADASNLGFSINQDKVNIREDTAKLCHFFNIDPLQLISSGSLLLTVRPTHCGSLVEKLVASGIDAADIGEVVGKDSYEIVREGTKQLARRPPQDALWDALN